MAEKPEKPEHPDPNKVVEEEPEAECPVCYVSLVGIETGQPEGCQHHFCLNCLRTWVREHNTCPVDRHEFTRILATNRAGKAVDPILVPRRRRCRRRVRWGDEIDDWQGRFLGISLRESDDVAPILDWSQVRISLPESERNRPRPAVWNPRPAGSSSYNWWANNGAQSGEQQFIQVENVQIQAELLREVLDLPN